LTDEFLLGDWQRFSVSFNPSWTDAEARAAGWLQDSDISPSAIESPSFKETMQSVYSFEVRISGTGFLEAGIDNFALLSEKPR
jgi:hypothetical protein